MKLKEYIVLCIHVNISILRKLKFVIFQKIGWKWRKVLNNSVRIMSNKKYILEKHFSLKKIK